MDIHVGRVVLGGYAVFLAVGGLAGLAAGSRASLVAGMGSAGVCLVLLGMSFLGWPRVVFLAGALLAGGLAGLFLARVRLTGKWMPGVALAAISLVVATLLIWVMGTIEPAPRVAPRSAASTVAPAFQKNAAARHPDGREGFFLSRNGGLPKDDRAPSAIGMG